MVRVMNLKPRDLSFAVFMVIVTAAFTLNEAFELTEAKIEITYPAMGDILSIPPGQGSASLRATFDLVAKNQSGDLVVPQLGEGGIFLHVKADGDQVSSHFTKPMDYIQLVKLEPGTHTLSMYVRRQVITSDSSLATETDSFIVESSVLLTQASVIFDVVLPDVPLFFPPPSSERDQFLHLQDTPKPYIGRDGLPAPIRIGVIASLKLDGQKTIWIEQFKHFPRNEYDFRFICYTANQANDGKMVELLNELNVPARLIDGLSISVELADVPDFPLNLVRLIRENKDMQRWTTDLRSVEVQFLQVRSCFWLVFLQVGGVLHSCYPRCHRNLRVALHKAYAQH